MRALLGLLLLAGCEDRTCTHTHVQHYEGYTHIRYDESVTRDRKGRVLSRTTIPIPIYHPPHDENVCDTWMVCNKDNTGAKVCHSEGNWVR